MGQKNDLKFGSIKYINILKIKKYKNFKKEVKGGVEVKCDVKIFGDNIINNICKIDNIFFNKNNDKNIVNELYVYYVLNLLTMNVNKNVVITSISLLSSIITLQSKEKNNIQAISEALEGLKNSGLITYEYLVSSSKKEYYNPLRIEFLKNDPLNNFTLIHNWMFKKASDPKEFFVLVYIQKWKNTSHKISLSEWAMKMGYSKNGVDLLLKKMQKEDKIKIISGKHVANNGKSQDVNDYLLVEDEYKTVVGDLTLSEIRDYIGGSNWGRVNEYGQYEELTQTDYDLYRTCKDYGIYLDFVGRCEYVLEKMRMYPGGDSNIIKFEKEYLRQVDEIGGI